MSNTVFGHAKEYYDSLAKQADYESAAGGEKLLVFRGSLTRTFDALGISRAYYTKISRALQELGCIQIMQRGSSHGSSVLVLHHPPDEVEWERVSDRRLTGALGAAILQRKLNDIEALVGGLDVKRAFAEHEKRLRRLEEKLGKETTD